ncbi:MAG: hypothetical protein GX349_02070 [Firmicutes bacterium]|nr:hypothetical protein [Bacillota bacterium]
MKNNKKHFALTILTLILLVPGLLFSACTPRDKDTTIKIGAQNYAEVMLMAHAAQALIEDQTDYKVEIVPRLGSILVLEQAMQANEVDIASLFFTGGVSGILHPDYADMVDLREEKWRDPDYIWEFLQEKEPETHGRVWLSPLGWNNTYAVTVSRQLAEEYNLEKISDLQGLSQDLTIGMDDAYLEREIDGYYPLLEFYELEPFKKPVSMQINLLYKAIQERQVDVGVAYSSDARIFAYDLVWLEDDRNLYPPFHAAYCVTTEALERAPEIKEILEQLSGKVDIDTILRLNYEVDINDREEEEVAIEFLQELGLLSS